MVVTGAWTLAVIPARGGSKGIPRKNLAMVAGHPLIAYSIAGALAAERVHRVIVSTDDLEIADVARAYGAEVPFIRPAELATDDTPDLPVFDHALGWLAARAGDPPDILVHLRPTSPLRQVADIDRAVDLLRENPTADSVRSVCAPFQNPYKMWRLTDHGLLAPLLGAEVEEPYNLPHQKLPPVYWQTGYIDATRYRTIVTVRSMTGGAILPLVIGDDSWVDIDTRAMLEHADFLIRTGRVKVATPRRV